MQNKFIKGDVVINAVHGVGIVKEKSPQSDAYLVMFFDSETGTMVPRTILAGSLALSDRSKAAFPKKALSEMHCNEDRFFRMRRAASNKPPITHPKEFKSMGHVDPVYAKKAFDYAYRLVFSSNWNGNPLSDPDESPKSKAEEFCNVFLGKLGHCAVDQLLQSRSGFRGENIQITGFDAFAGFSINKYQDLGVNGKPTLVRATKKDGQLLLLSKYAWSKDGTYKKNNQKYSFIFLARIDNDPETILRKAGLIKENVIDSSTIEDLFSDVTFNYDVPGFITRYDLIYLMNAGFSVHKGSGYGDMFNVDSDSWYCQCNDLRSVESFNP